MTIVIPELSPDASSLETALALGEAGVYVLPSRANGDTKHPGSVVGAGWPSKSSTSPEWAAAWFSGTDHRVMAHCGRSGLVAFDVDHPERIPEPLRRAIDEFDPPFQQTRPDQPGRGHFIFEQPPGRRIGNRSGQLGAGWGEVRGLNGVILIGGEGRKWPKTGTVPMLPDYLADLLPDVGDANSAVSDVEVARFVEAHRLALAPRDLESIISGFVAAVEGGASRHNTAISAACWIVRETIEHRFAADKALRRLEGEFVPALVSTGRDGKPVSRDQAEAEFMSIVAWSVAQEWRPDGVGQDAEPAQAEDAEQSEREDPAAHLQRIAHELAVADRLRQLNINAEARQLHDAASRPPRRPISDRVVDYADLASIPTPRMLIKRLMPDCAVGFLNGRSGSYKSFLLVALAMAIGTGSPVMAHSEFKAARRGKVLYVAGEGGAGVALRLRAYGSAHGIDASGQVVLHTESINLSDPVDVAELYDYAANEGFTDVFVDTFRANAVGVQEKDSTEVGVVIAGAIRARDQYRLGTLYSDHTGHEGERAVGAEAKWANVDYALMVKMPSADRRADQQRVLRVEKLKDLETTGEWKLRLRAVPAIRDDDGNASAVLEVGEVSDGPAAAWGLNGSEWLADEVQPELLELLPGGGDGRSIAVCIVRILRRLTDEDGLTNAELRSIMKEAKVEPRDSTFYAAKKMLKEARITVDGRGSSRTAIHPDWAA